ncbi:MAG: FAD-binding domain-containing protein [Xanthomonadales bacterium]|jgi:deoxyribodipyrimidine photo-lyase|nr:FAD-binding domain-containing protein [Xanthomonadales bacterium]
MFTPDRASGLARLDAFLPQAGTAYARRRNTDLGPGDNDHVSRLSPWLRHRLVLEQEVLGAVLDRHGAGDAEKFIDEVFWRSYFRGWMAQHRDAWALYRQAVTAGQEAADADSGLGERVADAEAGRSGNPAVDRWARELRDTGYLHNHARMWFASLWIFTLRLPWALGADFFLRHLLDGDPASNTLSWRWVAGLHTRGKTYLARRDNILKFTEGRIDPGDGIATHAEPLDEALAPERTGIAWPAPPVTGNHPAWLVTEEDCRGDDLLPASAETTARFGLLATSARSPGPVAPAVRAFGEGAVRDALARSGAPDGACFEGSDAGLESLVENLSRAGIDTIHTGWAPYGPVADALAQLTPKLREAGMTVQFHVRAMDREAWPFADRGFFKLKKKIPRVLASLDAEAPDA